MQLSRRESAEAFASVLNRQLSFGNPAAAAGLNATVPMGFSATSVLSSSPGLDAGAFGTTQQAKGAFGAATFMQQGAFAPPTGAFDTSGHSSAPAVAESGPPQRKRATGERKQRKLEGNRKAAQRSRLKKKLYIANLEVAAADLERKNEEAAVRLRAILQLRGKGGRSRSGSPAAVAMEVSG